MLEIIRSTDSKALAKFLRDRTTTLEEAEAVVRPILATSAVMAIAP